MSIFPQNIRIGEVREAIEGRADFRELVFDDHSVFVYYLGLAKDIFPDPLTAPTEKLKRLYQLRRECRGLVFGKDGTLLARRFHKFFNVGEQAETEPAQIDLSQPYVVTEKLDGTMISPYFSNGKLRFATKSGITDISYFVEEYVERQQVIPYVKFCTAMIERGLTCLFEYCGPRAPIVLRYEAEHLKLLSLRHMETGHYVPFPEMTEIASSFEPFIPVCKVWTPKDFGLNTETERNFTEFALSIKAQENVEGFVLRFDSGLMLKLKTDWYFSVNHALQNLRSKNERKVWKIVLDEEYDDLKMYLTPKRRQLIDTFTDQLSYVINGCVRENINKVMMSVFVPPECEEGSVSLNKGEDTTRRRRGRRRVIRRREMSEFIRSQPKYTHRFLWKTYTKVVGDVSFSAEWFSTGEEDSSSDSTSTPTDSPSDLLPPIPDSLSHSLRLELVSEIVLTLKNPQKFETCTVPLLGGFCLKRVALELGLDAEEGETQEEKSIEEMEEKELQ
eukprot:TRINITY_DN10471_c0_g1_i1.p1 TRINITY_DN10471_c0_g1~~TRINITY_DN10471_c0_g1_i1.p1  ORF type:complete len:503 (-),score=108.84 TRINITY_DN10471_c0_g1_i1:100-1608(-)